MRETVIKDLSFSYPGTDKLVLKDINMDVAEGEFVSILRHRAVANIAQTHKEYLLHRTRSPEIFTFSV